MNVRSFAPVIPRDKWRKRNGKLEACCPWCDERQIIANRIVDGFTEGAIYCRMPDCRRFDWVRLEGWDE